MAMVTPPWLLTPPNLKKTGTAGPVGTSGGTLTLTCNNPDTCPEDPPVRSSLSTRFPRAR